MTAGLSGRLRRSISLFAVTALLLVAGVTATTASAAVTTLGTLSFAPSTGTDISPINFTTISSGATKGCPSGTSNVFGVVNGPTGSGWTDIVALSNTSTNVSNTEDFSLPIVDTFNGIAQTNSLTIVPGTYTVSIKCQNRLGSVQAGAFVAPLYFTDATHFQSNDPAQVAQGTTTAVSASPVSPSAAGTPVTFTAAVSPSTAAGTVQFKDGGVNLGSAQTVSSGTASLTTSGLSVSTHTVTATFTPASSGAFAASTSTSVSYVVTGTSVAAATSTTVTASPASTAAAGTTVTFTAAVSPLGATGSVQFKDGSTNLGASQQVSSGQASVSSSALAAGPHSISAAFTPSDAGAFLPSSAPAVSYQILAGTATSTTTSLTVNPTTAIAHGAAVTFTASISPSASGTVQFADSGVNFGVAQVVTAGSATLSSSTLTVGTHQVTATFTPADAGLFAGSTSAAVSVTVNAAAAVPNLGTLTFSPAVGQDISPIGISVHSTGTAKGCPVGASNVYGVVNGPTGWSNITVVTNANSGVSSTEDFLVPMQDTFFGVAATNALTITAGRYDFTLDCQNRLGTIIYGTFSGSLFFTDSTHYQSTDPSNTVVSTATALVVGPDARQDIGKPITLSASVSPGTAVGAIQFTDTTQGLTVNIGAPVPLSLGANAVRVVSTLPFGLHTFAAKFIPANAQHFSASASDNIVYVVALPAPPHLVKAVHLLGNGRIGSVLTCSSTITGATSISYSWFRNGKAIGGVTTSTYRLAVADRLTLIACRVTARNTGGTTQSMSPVAFVGLLSFRMYAAPALSGRHVLGALMSTDGGRWTPAPASYRYVWLRDGKAIPGAVKQSYKVSKADAFHKLSVRVTVGALFYDTAVAVSRSG